MILKYTELILADQNSSLSNLLLVPWEIPLSAQKSFSVSGAHRAAKVRLGFTMRTPMCIEYISGASFGGRLEARPWLGRARMEVSRSCDGGPASSRGGPWRSACSGGGRRGHGTLAAGGTATEAGGARTNKN